MSPRRTPSTRRGRNGYCSCALSVASARSSASRATNAVICSSVARIAAALRVGSRRCSSNLFESSRNAGCCTGRTSPRRMPRTGSSGRNGYRSCRSSLRTASSRRATRTSRAMRHAWSRSSCSRRKIPAASPEVASCACRVASSAKLGSDMRANSRRGTPLHSAPEMEMPPQVPPPPPAPPSPSLPHARSAQIPLRGRTLTSPPRFFALQQKCTELFVRLHGDTPQSNSQRRQAHKRVKCRHPRCSPLFGRMKLSGVNSKLPSPYPHLLAQLLCAWLGWLGTHRDKFFIPRKQLLEVRIVFQVQLFLRNPLIASGKKA
ncbi:hypothetical protein C3747_6g360 [Trypanosoma cruzi]|uniref:Uncharacterized protein n=1 Tax=Trypanosoma cruzi TaxID=5693 RepID=A0A2V2XIK8_TRYCR|nr:hypothetical protein C3747_6g360 [Trypanosoma cruzi]